MHKLSKQFDCSHLVMELIATDEHCRQLVSDFSLQETEIDKLLTNLLNLVNA